MLVVYIRYSRSSMTMCQQKRPVMVNNFFYVAMTVSLIVYMGCWWSSSGTPDPRGLTMSVFYMIVISVPKFARIGKAVWLIWINNARVSSLQRFQRIELLKQHFWNRFSNEYILWLQNRTKWRASKGTLEEGTMVIVKDKTIPPLMWLLGRVVRIFPGSDGIVRVADIKTRKGIIRRAFNNICPLPIKSVED
ncbi:hypothetical protein NE865_06457 [Phthorimaea operculella]|nr:hypothetical protein NE865_06457 [Phthorimaea operculella]